YGDDVRVRQVITNILTNAIKYTPSGNVWFRVSGVRKSKEIFILHAEVEDTGMGMRPEDVKRLFSTSFQRVNQEKTRYIEGTGLGLMITQQLLKLMGSKLEVFSEYEKGSKFYFDLEQKVVDPTPIGDFNERVMRSEVSVKKYNGFSAPDAQILVVDDNSMNRKVFKSLLKTTLIHITEAESGQEAIDLATEHFYDIIFMDHMMPEMDGVEAMHRIREIKDGPCANTPIIVLTANAVSGAKEMYKEEGFDGFISKPVVADKLEEAIKDALPADLIKAPIEEKEAPKKSAGMPDDLPMVEGLDWGFAWQHLPDLDVLKDTLAEFYELLPVHKKKLEGMYADILSEVEDPSSEEGLKNAFSAYRIQVHSMKGAAATIGIVPLAGAAKILEFAAKDEDPETIRSLHPIFIKEWMSYADKLYGVFDIGIDRTEKIPGTPEIFHEESEVIRQALEDMDIDAADEHMEKLKGYTFGEKADELMKELSAAVADLDEDAAAEIIASMQEYI
ncbi:MAG: response regulator, partial [Lachnospiraceae bacterium]|nr:response regulator [Lachnospiraceae bacterium]